MIRIITSIILSLFLITPLNAQTAIKMQKKGGVYVVPCKVNGLPLKFIFDTGASDVSISMSEAIFMIKNEYLSEDDIKGSEYYSIANGDIQEGTTINLKVVEISGLKLYNVKAAIVHSLEAPLLLGQSALQKLGRIEFDYSSEKLLIFEENDSILEKRRSLEIETTHYLDSLYDEKAILYYDKGYAEGKMGNYNNAISFFDRAIEIEDKYVNAYLYRALAHILLASGINPYKPASYDYDLEQKYENEFKLVYQHCQQVYEDANKVLSIESDDYRAYFLKGRAKLKLKDNGGAVLEFNNAIRFGQDSKMIDKYYLLRAKTHYDLDKYTKTIKDCNSCIKVSNGGGSIGEAYYYRALSKEKLFGTRYAMNDFSKAGESGFPKAYGEIEERKYKNIYPYLGFWQSMLGGVLITIVFITIFATFTILLTKKIRKKGRKKAHNNVQK